MFHERINYLGNLSLKKFRVVDPQYSEEEANYNPRSYFIIVGGVVMI